MSKKRKNLSEGDGGDGRALPPAEQKKKKSRLEVPPHRLVLAPMVGGSELAFRMLVRRYSPAGTLAYTPMMSSARFAAEPEYRDEIFSTLPEDRPLVAHFCANDPQQLLAAARLIESQVDAIDLNLGCPQRIAHSGHFGSFLLDDVDRPLVESMIRTLATSLAVPVFAKIRLLETTEKTIELVTQLRDAGASLVAIHARHRVSLVGRSGPTARDGPAFLDEVAKVRKAVSGVELISNGNITTWEDVCSAFEQTGADGVMSAEGLLDDPALFFPATKGEAVTVAAAGGDGIGNGSGSDAAPSAAGADNLSEEERLVRKLTKKLKGIERLEEAALGRAGGLDSLSKEEALKVGLKSETEAELAAAQRALRKRLKKQHKEQEEAPAIAAAASAPAASKPASKRAASATKPSPLQLAQEYVELARRHPVPHKTLVFHVRRMAKGPLITFQLLSDVLEAPDLPAVEAVLQTAVGYAMHGYTPDPDKAQKEKAALELKKWRESTRKRFEERMERKAMRAGLPRDHYLSRGAEVPTTKGLAELKAMAPAAAWETWKSAHGQHCWAMHMEVGGCTRERTCAFLHADAKHDDDDQSTLHWG